jgi:hypothetical protein
MSISNADNGIREVSDLLRIQCRGRLILSIVEEYARGLSQHVYLWIVVLNRLLLVDEVDGTVTEVNVSVLSATEHNIMAGAMVGETQACKNSSKPIAKRERVIISRRGWVKISRRFA